MHSLYMCSAEYLTQHLHDTVHIMLQYTLCSQSVEKAIQQTLLLTAASTVKQPEQACGAVNMFAHQQQ